MAVSEHKELLTVAFALGLDDSVGIIIELTVDWWNPIADKVVQVLVGDARQDQPRRALARVFGKEADATYRQVELCCARVSVGEERADLPATYVSRTR